MFVPTCFPRNVRPFMSSLHVNLRFSHLLRPFHHFWLRKFDSLRIALLHKLSRQPIDITPQATHWSLKTYESCSWFWFTSICMFYAMRNVSHHAFNVFQCHLTVFFNRVQRVAFGDWHCKWPRSSWIFWEKHHRPQDTWKIMTKIPQNSKSGSNVCMFKKWEWIDDEFWWIDDFFRKKYMMNGHWMVSVPRSSVGSLLRMSWSSWLALQMNCLVAVFSGGNFENRMGVFWNQHLRSWPSFNNGVGNSRPLTVAICVSTLISESKISKHQSLKINKYFTTCSTGMYFLELWPVAFQIHKLFGFQHGKTSRRMERDSLSNVFEGQNQLSPTRPFLPTQRRDLWLGMVANEIMQCHGELRIWHHVAKWLWNFIWIY